MQKVEQYLSPLYDGVVGNRKNWQTLAEEEKNDSEGMRKEQCIKSFYKMTF